MNQSAVHTTELPDRVPCLIISLADRKLLLPITAIAEVINTFSQPEAGQENTALYGWIDWRDQRIPLLSAETAMGGARQELRDENRIAVINAIGDAEKIGYYAILLQGLPTPVQASPESLTETGTGTQAFSLGQAQVGEEAVILPDLIQLESLVAGFPAG